MTIVDTNKMNVKYKCIYCIMLLEKTSELITDLTESRVLRNAVTHCWEWIETGRYCGQDFLQAVIDEMRTTGFLDYHIDANIKNDIKSSEIWNSNVFSIMYIVRKAYEKDGYTRFPEAVGEVHESNVQYAIEALSKIADIEAYTDEIYELCLKETKISDIQRRFGLYQMDIDFAKLSEKYKCVFLLMLAEKLLSCIENEEERDYSQSALQACWEWLDIGRHSGASLIDFVGDDDSGIFSYEIAEEEPVVTAALNFVVTAVSFVSRIAFENEGVQDMPKFAAVTTDAVIPYVLDRFTMCYTNANQYISNVYKICLEEREPGYYYQIVKQF